MDSPSKENLEVSVSAVVESVSEETGMAEEDRSSSPSLTTVLSGECRICHTEDSVDHMEAPCSCNGTLKFAHRDCIQRWINSRFKTTCEICNQPYEGGYRVTVPPPATPSQLTRMEIENIRRVMDEAERLQEAAARAELYLTRLNAANDTVSSRNSLCRIAIVFVIGFYILIIASKLGSGVQNGIGPPSPSTLASPSPSPHDQLQSSPQFTRDNNSPGGWSLWG